MSYTDITFKLLSQMVKDIMPSAVIVFLVTYAIRLSWNILRGKGLK